MRHQVKHRTSWWIKCHYSTGTRSYGPWPSRRIAAYMLRCQRVSAEDGEDWAGGLVLLSARIVRRHERVA